MKFLLWQFLVYALVSMAVGVALATVWARSTRSALERAFDRARRTGEAESATATRLRQERADDLALVQESQELASNLAQLRSALRLLEAEVQSNDMARLEADRARQEADAQLARERGAAARLEVVDGEVVSLAAELERARLAIRELRAQGAGQVNALRNERDTLREALTRLQKSHDRLVVSEQSRETVALLRAEEAETLLRLRQAEDVRRKHEEVPTPPEAARPASSSTVSSTVSSNQTEVPQPILDLRSEPGVVIDLTALEAGSDRDASNDELVSG